jgi:methylase of polypeptide subunit release factors
VSAHPTPDAAAARTLGRALRNVGYSEDAIYDLLGDDAYSVDRADAAVEARRLPQTPLATVIRAVFLQLSVAHADAVRALGPRGVEALAATGLAEVGDQVTPRSRILPVGKVLLASDGFSLDADDPADYVATYTPTAQVLDSLTPRAQIERALDVGTGSGIHALLAAQQARHVVATDVNERALAYTSLNAGLNGLDNIDVRRGSLFEPVAGESFDLITCNAPYVVSPERRWAYRDSGFEADELSQQVVREAAAHLSEGGFASVQVSWLAPDEDQADNRIVEWVEATGCDGWIMPTLSLDALEHAAEWNSHLSGRQLTEALDLWTSYLAELDVRWVSEGVVILHRRSDAQPTLRIDPVDDDALEDAGDQIRRAFAARARLGALDGRDELLDARVSLAMNVRLEEELEPDGDGGIIVAGGRVDLTEGTRHDVETTSEALEVVASLDSSLPLGEIVTEAAERLGLADTEQTRLRREALRLSRELLELGALELRGG